MKNSKFLSFWLVQNLSEGFPASGNDNKTSIGFFDAMRSLPQGYSSSYGRF